MDVRYEEHLLALSLHVMLLEFCIEDDVCGTNWMLLVKSSYV